MIFSKTYSRHIAVFLAVFTVLQLVILVAIYHLNQTLIQNEIINTASNTLTVYNNYVSNAVNRADTDLRTVINQDPTVKLLSNPNENTRLLANNSILNTMKTCLRANEYTDAYVVYNCSYDTFLIERNSHISYSEIEAIQGYIVGFQTDTKTLNSGWLVEQIGGSSYLLHFYHYNQNIFAAFFDVETLASTSPFYGVFGDSQSLVLSDAAGNRLANVGNCGAELSGFPAENNTPHVLGNYSVISRDTGVAGLKTTYIALYTSVNLFYQFPILIAVVCIVAILMMVLFIRYMNREVMEPVNELMITAQTVETGNLEYRAHLHCGNPEFNGLAESFNSMLDMIIRQRIEAYEQIIKQQDTELKYLQMQIRPHFFLNALSTIHSMSYQDDNRKIRNFIELFSKNVRYMFKSGLHTVPLSEEIGYIQNYLDCQNLLYPDCVFSYLEISPDTYQWQIPQMLIHTFVENVYKHTVAFGSLVSLFIRTSIVSLDGETMLMILVEDSGKGFPEDVIRSVNSEEAENNGSKSIGLINMCHTMYLMYGRRSLIRISNQESGGCSVRAYVPQHTVIKDSSSGGLPNHETADR